MDAPDVPHPTELELDILRVVWRTKRATVRQVVDALKPQRDLALTTVTTVMNRMLEKGWLVKKKEGRGRFLYSAKFSQDRTRRGVLRDIIHRLFEGSVPSLIQNAIDMGEMSKGELAAIRRLLEENRGEKE